jgi:predicted DNA-binding transcriptional regulator AlpA
MINNTDKKIDELPGCAVLSKKEVSALTGLSRFTLERMHRERSGPPRVQLSQRRCGYQLDKLLAWLEAHTDATTAA